MGGDKGTLKRFFYFIFLVLSVYLLPWWLVALALAAGVFLFRLYYEGFLIALFLDIIYGAGSPSYLNFAFFFTLGYLTIYLAGSLLKKRLIYYPK